jgi:predicted dehydrogenase
MLKVAIIGCGKIADLHAQQILRFPEARIVAACDSEPLMAHQLKDRFPIDRAYGSVPELLSNERPDIVHITTPPESHLSLATMCLEANSHVYVEKPFTVDLKQAVELIAAAQRCQRKVTVGHNVQFTRPAMIMRQMIADGFLGGTPRHMESFYAYDLGDTRYVKALLGDKNHWVRRLPGKLLQNILSHGIAKIAEYLPGEDLDIKTIAFPSVQMRDAGEDQIFDELRVVILDRASQATAYFSFSTQVRPLLHQFRIYGARNGLLTDDDHQVILKLHGKRRKSYLEQFLPPVLMAKQYASNGMTNVRDFLGRRLHNDLGMGNLIAAFYSSIISETEPPIPYREIIATTSIMERIFGQVFAAAPHPDA